MSKKLILRLNKNINEARLTIDDEYTKNWSDIPREDFDTIIAMDPKTSIETDLLGPNAKQLLLPKYREGEKDFLEKGDEVKAAIEKFIANRGSYEIKNIAMYPSVDLFVKHINDPENNPVEVNNAEEKKESKLDTIYNKYYSGIPRELFDQIILLDPNTRVDAGSLGEVAKNLLLANANKGEQFVLDANNFDKIRKAIDTFYAERASMDQESQQLSAYEGVEAFVNLMEKPKNSPLVDFVLSHTSSSDVRYVGSTFKYDVFVVKNTKGAAAVAGAYVDQGGPGVTSSGSSRSWSSNKYGHWCTTDPGFWNNYNGAGQRYYDFMARGKNLTADSRAHNFQFAIKADGEVTSAADGVEVYDKPELMRLNLFKKELGDARALDAMIALLSKETKDDGTPGYAALLREVVQANISKKFCVPFTYTKHEDLLNLESQIKTYDPNGTDGLLKEVYSKIPELHIAEGVTEIPFGAFVNWTFIKEIKFPDTLRSIGAQSFKGCLNLRRVIFNEGLESIGAQAFAGCTSLENKRTYLPNSVKRLGQKAFLDTNITLLIASDRPEHSLSIHKSDKQWFADHSAFTNVTQAQENWDTNITEEIIDEKIPRDLADIYRVRGNHTGEPKITSHDISKKSSMTNRRSAQIDFEAAQYEVVTALEAATRVSQNKNSAEKIRAIYEYEGQKDYLELELRPGWNKVYPIHIPEPANVAIKKPDIDSHTGKPIKIGQPVSYEDMNYYTKDNIMHEVQSIDGLYRILSGAIKIYWTDEYEHLPGNDDAFRNKLNARSSNKDRRLLYRTPGEEDKDAGLIDVSNPDTWITKSQYKWSQKRSGGGGDGFYTHPSLTQYSFKVADTGTHKDTSITGDIDYDKLLVKKKRAKKKYLDILKAHKNLLRNKDLYTEEELAAEEEIILQDEKDAYEAYMECNRQIQVAKKHFVSYYSKDLDASQTYIKKYLKTILDIKELIVQRENDLRELENQYKKLLDTNVVDYGELKDELKKIDAARADVDAINRRVNEKQNECSALKQQIEQLQAKLKEQEDAILADSEQIRAKVSEIAKRQGELESVAEKTAEELSDQLDSVEAQIDTIKGWFVKKGLKQYSFKKHREMDDRIASMIDLRDSIPGYVCVDERENELKFFGPKDMSAAVDYAESHPEVYAVYGVENFDMNNNTYDWGDEVWTKEDEDDEE